MATTSVKYNNLDGSQTVFSIPFDYAKKDHVKATVDGSSVSQSSFSVSGSQVTFNTGPTGDLEIYRETPLDNNLVDYAKSSALRASDLNLQNDQHLFILQEHDVKLDTVEENADVTDSDNVESSLGSVSIDAHSDVDTTSTAPSAGQTLEWDGSNWVPADPSLAGDAVKDIDDLSDVDTSSSPPSNGEVLEWDGSNWVPAPQSGGASKMDDLSDVDTSTQAPVAGQVLEWDGSNWAPQYANDHSHDNATTQEAGFLSSSDKQKIDNIEPQATQDQTGAEIKSLYEAEPDTNAFSDSYKSKVDNIEANADVTDSANVEPALSSVSIDALSDVDTGSASPGTGDHLQWDGSNWVPAEPPAGGISSINEIPDVDTSTSPPSTGDHLEWDGSDWVPGAAGGGASKIDDLSDVDTTTAAPDRAQLYELYFWRTARPR